MRLLILFAILTAHLPALCQTDDWIAPEGKIINYRTLNWNDFIGKPRGEEDKYTLAAVCPAIYYYADSGHILPNGRVAFKFTVKCAFQSDAFVREATAKEHTNYYLIHEQNHYDIALTYARLLQQQLSARDYSKDNYSDEMDKVNEALYKNYRKTQTSYDGEVNPEGRMEKEKQYLWDMRVRKCMEQNTDEFYASPEAVVQTVRGLGQTVKRIPGEPARQFVVRARPLYTEYPQEMVSRLIETQAWTDEKSIIAFYTQKYYLSEDGMTPKDYLRVLAFAFVPNGKDTYRRVLIDTFSNLDKPVKIVAAFFANADSDATRELVILTSTAQRDARNNGTHYSTRIYDNIKPKALPAKLKKLDDVAAKVSGGFEGDMDGKPLKAKYKTEAEVAEALTKMGYITVPPPPVITY